jgi:hypothetical protein
MSNETEFDTALMAEQLEALATQLSLTDEQRNRLRDNPSLLSGIWSDTKDAIMLFRFRSILDAQVQKALKGDTSAAKFVVDFAQPTIVPNDGGSTGYKWEELAIQLRDSLELELSAETVVEIVLATLTSWPVHRITNEFPKLQE